MRRIGLGGAAVLAACALALPAGAQTSNDAAKMYGSVTDESGAGLAGVKIILEPVEGGSKVELVTRGKKGSYFFGIIRPGMYQLRVEAQDAALISVKAQAKINDVQRRDEEWKIEGRVSPDKPPKMRLTQGMEVACDMVVGKAVAVTTASGEKAMASPDQAYAVLAEQVKKGDCAGAMPQIEAFTAANPTHARAFYLAGYCQAVLEHEDEAIAALTKSAELDPSFVGTQLLLGKMYVRIKKYPEAEAAFQKELDNPKASPDIRIDSLLSLGSVQRDQKKMDEAIATYQKVIEAAPTRPEPYIEMSGLYLDTGKLDKAESILNDAKAAGADDPAALLNVGIIYFNKKDWAHAEAVCKRVIEGSKASNPDMGSAYAILGRAQLNSGKTADGTAALKKSLELDPAGRFAAQTEEILKALAPAPKKK